MPRNTLSSTLPTQCTIVLLAEKPWIGEDNIVHPADHCCVTLLHAINLPSSLTTEPKYRTASAVNATNPDVRLWPSQHSTAKTLSWSVTRSKRCCVTRSGRTVFKILLDLKMDNSNRGIKTIQCQRSDDVFWLLKRAFNLLWCYYVFHQTDLDTPCDFGETVDTTKMVQNVTRNTIVKDADGRPGPFED